MQKADTKMANGNFLQYCFLLNIEKNPQFKIIRKKQSRREFLKILTTSLLSSEPEFIYPPKKNSQLIIEHLATYVTPEEGKKVE